LLREPETEEELVKNPVLYGTPLLFPPNRIEDGRFEFQGKTYSFPINEPERRTHLHGNLYQTPFEAEDISESEATFVYHATEEKPYFDYHALRVQITYLLDESGLKQTVTIFNESSEPLPVGLGFHTAFPTPFLPEGSPEDILLQGELGAEYTRDSERLLTVWEPLPDSETHRTIENGTFCPHGRGVSAQYRCGNSRTMRIIDQKTGTAIVYEISENYFSWLTWKPQGSDFLCLEPQSWLVNAPYAPNPAEAGLKTVAPGESMMFSTRLYLSAKDYNR